MLASGLGRTDYVRALLDAERTATVPPPSTKCSRSISRLDVQLEMRPNAPRWRPMPEQSGSKFARKQHATSS